VGIERVLGKPGGKAERVNNNKVKRKRYEKD
jgi:hypothetical protein